MPYAQRQGYDTRDDGEGRVPFQRNLYRGTIRSFQPRRKTIPVWQNKTILGTEGNVFTLVKCWLHEANLNFPEYGLFISFNNGAGSAFCKLGGVAELEGLATTIQEWITEIRAQLPVLTAKQDFIKEQIKQIDNMKSQMEAMNLFKAAQVENEPPLDRMEPEYDGV